jgi:hypothetical protein
MNCKLQITNLQHDQVCKFIGSQVFKIKMFTNYKLIITNFQFVNMQNYQITKLPKLQILEVHFCIFTSKSTCSICMLSDLHVLQNSRIMNI